MPPAAALLSTYYYPSPFTIGSYLAASGARSLRVGQDFAANGFAISYSRAVLACDVIAGDDGVTPAGYWGFPGSGFSYFLTAHYDRGQNKGGNALHGDGSVEWLPYAWGNGNWFTFAGGGDDHWFVSNARQL